MYDFQVPPQPQAPPPPEDVLLTRSLWKGTNLELTSFLHYPMVIRQQKVFQIRCYPTLFLHYKNRNAPSGRAYNGSFKIAQRSLWDVVAFLKRGCDWFHDPAMPDLFFLDDKRNNVLMFNQNYKNLLSVVKLEPPDAGALRMEPGVVPIPPEDIGVEGVKFYVNGFTNLALLRKEELIQLYLVLSHMDFNSEALLMLSVYQEAKRTDTIRTDPPEGFRY